VIQVGEWRTDFEKCANCATRWPQGYVFALQNFYKLVGAIAEAKKMKDAKDLPFSVRFELASDPKDKI
jgi:hypothetical protein